MNDSLRIVADLMAIAARTAPKAHGKDFLEIKVIEGQDLQRLGEDMYAYGEESGKATFDRDGQNVLNCGAVLLVSLAGARHPGLNCGACGYSTCAALAEAGLREGPEFAGPICAWRIIDLGIALGSAAKIASMLNVDNRIMYKIGVSARRLKLIDGELVVGIPLAATGKNIFFDRQ